MKLSTVIVRSSGGVRVVRVQAWINPKFRRGRSRRSCSSCSSYFGVVYELLGLRAASSKLAYVCVELSEHSGS